MGSGQSVTHGGSPRNPSRFDHANADGVTVTGGSWTGTRWEGADLRGATFDGCDQLGAEV